MPDWKDVNNLLQKKETNMQIFDFNKDWTWCREGENEQRPVTLPHDAMLHEERSAKAESESAGAYFPGGLYLYRKVFDVPVEWKGAQVLIRFEGVYRNAVITINGQKEFEIINGYTERSFDLSEALRYGESNELTVRVDNSKQPNSRWYSGSGIYRPVKLIVLPAVRIEEEGVKIRTLSIHPAEIEVTTTHCGGQVKVEILDGTASRCIASGEGDRVCLTVPDARLWSADHPYLYTCRVTLWKEADPVDFREIPFGIRTLAWNPQGFFVNGESVLLRGGCLHHDNGVLGACAFDEAEERKVRIMKELGFNAIRSSHNPCSRALLDACDKYGMYMMDETWDMWYQHKSKYDYADRIREYWQADIRALVRKDFNHPSIILYSIGNEISEPAKPEGMEFARGLIELFHTLDPDRPVTAGLNLMIVANAAKGQEMYNAEGGLNTDTAVSVGGGDAQAQSQMPDFSKMDSTMFNMIAMHMGSGMNHSADGEDADAATSPILDALDLAGYNYASGRYPLEGEKHPERVIFGSETLPPDLADNWEMVKKYPYLVGDFMWTAFDYLGEAGIGAWSYSKDAAQFNKPYPWLIGGAGVIDILGNPDAETLWAGMVWGTNHGVRIAVTPANHPGEVPYHSAWRGTNAIRSWSWSGCEGNPVQVEVYTDGAEAELFINGKSLGRKPAEKCRAVFDVHYVPGTLEAVSYDAKGQETGRDTLTSAEGDLKISLNPEVPTAHPDQVIYIPVTLADAHGTVESNADEPLHAYVEGGELLGFGSANPRTVDSFVTGTYTTYYGRALAVIRAGNGNGVRLKVTSETGKLAEITLAIS